MLAGDHRGARGNTAHCAFAILERIQGECDLSHFVRVDLNVLFDADSNPRAPADSGRSLFPGGSLNVNSPPSTETVLALESASLHRLVRWSPVAFGSPKTVTCENGDRGSIRIRAGCRERARSSLRSLNRLARVELDVSSKVKLR
jgi:hypothetical protein